MVERGMPVQQGRPSRRHLHRLAWCATLLALTMTTTGCYSLWGFGANSSAQLGLGHNASLPSPTQVGSTSDWKAISAGSTLTVDISEPGLPGTVDVDHTCGIRLDASLWCWGYRVTQAFPDGYYDAAPVRVGTATWKAVSAGALHNCAIKADDTLWCWGYGTFGQVGDGTMFGIVTQPVQVGTQTWRAVAAGSTHTCGIQTNGSLWCWGRNDAGQVGNGTPSFGEATPIQVGANSWKSVSADGRFAPDVFDGHTCAVRADNTLWCWGQNGWGQLGDGTTTDRSVPVPVGTTTWKSVEVGAAHSCAVRSDSSLWCWGENTHGQLGDGSTTHHPTPERAGDRFAYVGCSDSPPFTFCTSPWESVTSGGDHTCGVRFDHTLWCWGKNSFGQLGDGGTVERGFPGQIGTDTSWLVASAGGNHTEALHR